MRQLRLVYFALIFSTFIYAVLVWILMGQKTPAGTLEQELHRPEIMLFMAIAVATFAVSLFIRGERRERMILRWSIIEASTILGLLAAFLTNDWRLFTIGWALSLVGFALAFPPAEEA